MSAIGDWLYLVALLIVVERASGDPFVLGLVGAARVLPYVLLSVPAGYIADRYERRLVLLATDVARAAIMVAIGLLVAVDGPLWAIVALATLATCFSTFFGPTLGAFLPTLVRDESELAPANSAWATLDNLAFVIGPALAGLLVATGGLVLAFLLNAGSFVLVIGVLAGLGAGRPAGSAELVGPAALARTGAPGADAVPGAGVVTGADQAASLPGAAPDPGSTAPDEPPAERAPAERAPAERAPASGPLPLAPVVALGALDTATSAIFGGLGILTVVLAGRSLGTGDDATGVLNAALGVGGLAGAFAAGGLVLRPNLAISLLAGAATLAVGLLVVAGGLAANAGLAVALGGLALAALGNLVLEVIATTLLQRAVPDALRGRALGSIATVSTLAYAAGSLLIPVLAGAIGVPPVLVGAAVALLLVTAAVQATVGALERTSAGTNELLGRLRDLPVFAGVPLEALDAAVRRMGALELGPGAVLVRQGDPADRCYVVRSGRLVVERALPGSAGSTVVDEIGPDEIVGELGLLRGRPRNATVRVVERSSLLALDGADFLALVSAAPVVRGRLLDLRRAALATDPGGDLAGAPGVEPA